MAESFTIDCDTNTISELAGCLNHLTTDVAPPEGSLQYNSGGVLAGTGSLTYNATGVGELVLNPTGAQDPFPTPLSRTNTAFVSGETISLNVGFPGKLDVARANSSSVGGDITVGDGFTIKNTLAGTGQTIKLGLAMPVMETALDLTAPGDHSLSFFGERGWLRTTRPTIPQVPNNPGSTQGNADAINDLIKTLAQYGLILTR